MTVGELIEELKAFDPNMPIVIWDKNLCDYIIPKNMTHPFTVNAIRVESDGIEDYVAEIFNGVAFD